MKKSTPYIIIVLASICTVVALLMAVTNFITAPIIERNEAKKANAALLEIMPEGGSFEVVDISGFTLPSTVTDVWKAEKGGYVVKMTTSGYSAGMVLMCGIDANGVVTGSKILSSAETPAIGGTAAATFAPTVIGTDLSTIDSVDTISGATKTTEAYRDAVKDAMNTVIILGGGEVDLRTEEEILQDNLSAALPAAEGKFEKHFFVEVVEGVDAIYFASNGKGAVCVIGESFIGVDANGTVLTECTAAEATAAKTAVETVSASKETKLDLTAYTGIHKNVVSAKVTESGNYILEIKGAGYGITGGDEYHPASGEYILIKVSLTAEGKIIDCLTLSQKETDGIGSACAEEEFYGQFDGTTKDTYDDINAISGATKTTDGYKKAILRAFETVEILTAETVEGEGEGEGAGEGEGEGE